MPNPIGSKITISGKKYFDGMKLEKGKYKIQIKKDRFVAKTVNLNLEKNTILEVNLEQNIFSLTVNVTPKDSKIYITNIESKYRDGILLKKGVYKIKVKKSGFTPKIVEVDLKKDTNINIDLTDENIINKDDVLIWSGEYNYFADLPYSGSTFKEVLDNEFKYELKEAGFEKETKLYMKTFSFNKTLYPKGEYETTAEFKYRKLSFNQEKEVAKKIFRDKYKTGKAHKIQEINKYLADNRKSIFNSWLGKQNIKMKYNAEIEKFDVSVNDFLNFQISVPRKEAREFKKGVKSFDIYFEYRNSWLWVIGAKTKIKNRKYSTIFEIDFEAEHRLNQQIISAISKWSKEYHLHLPSTLNELKLITEIISSHKNTSIDWQYNQQIIIYHIPEEIGYLSNLRELNLKDNYISKIPSSIGKLTNLEVLDLHGNHIESIPSSIGKLTELRTLNLISKPSFSLFGFNKNYISNIPNSLNNLQKLRICSDSVTRSSYGETPRECIKRAIGDKWQFKEIKWLKMIFYFIVIIYVFIAIRFVSIIFKAIYISITEKRLEKILYILINLSFIAIILYVLISYVSIYFIIIPIISLGLSFRVIHPLSLL